MQPIRLILIFSFFLAVIATPFRSTAQDRCGTVPYNKKLQEQELILQQDKAFEKWLEQKIQHRVRTMGSKRTQAAYTIPVVVHVIHNGEPVGSGSNISDEQIYSQIAVLNDDFQRRNADASNTPAEFLSVAGSLDIEFVLARQDPEGFATTGIVRVDGDRASWSMDDNYELKSKSYWPSENYMNLWVANLDDPNNIIGYAQFPVSDLPGLENASTNALTDGVVIHYKAFGTIDAGDFDLETQFNKGRTTTHEIGHFFGLRHISGDDNGSCGGDGDYVDDTPDQGSQNRNCPSHPISSCGATSMFQNYLDYTNDDCMNLFTKGQVDRMVVVLENSPRRKSLLTSPGLEEPEPVANDLGIKKIISPRKTECSGTVVPEIEIRNYGNNEITATQIRVRRNGVIIETKNFNLSLLPSSSVVVTFNPLALSAPQQTVRFEILSTNNTTDGHANDNSAEQAITLPETIETPFTENFNDLPAGWTILNPDDLMTWSLENAPHTSPTNKAMKMNFYDYEDHEGERDLLVTPVFDLSDATVGLLMFDVAYAQYSSSMDGLRVLAHTDCNVDVYSNSAGTEIFNRTGASLATAPATSEVFTPVNETQWKTYTINLNNFLGQSRVQLAFWGINDWGNNLYLDNIRVLTSDFENLTLKAIKTPSPVTCREQVNPVAIIRNSGTDVSSFSVSYTLNGITETKHFTDIGLLGGAEMEVTLPALNLSPGENFLTFEVSAPNGQTDLDPSDNVFTHKVLVNVAEDAVPLRQNFDTSFEDWGNINPRDGMPWQIKDFGTNKALYFNAFNNNTVGDAAWLVTPLLNFSSVAKASLFFDLSYVRRNNTTDQLTVLASTNCGESFDIILKDYAGDVLADSSSATAWEPSKENHWKRKFINLGAIAGKEGVRLAFVATNNHGNNLYLDNIEIFLSDDQSPLRIENAFAVYPNPSRYEDLQITFNLGERQHVKLEVIDPTGKILLDENLEDVLNQTYPLLLNNPATGLYVVRVRTQRTIFYSKLVITD